MFPAVRVDGDVLAWNTGLGDPRWVRSSPRMLVGFLGLDEATDETIASYAGRWGNLGICAHGLLHGHARNAVPDQSDCGQVFGQSEPIAIWRYWSRRAAAIRAVFRALQTGTDAKDDALRLLETPPWEHAPGWKPMTEVRAQHRDLVSRSGPRLIWQQEAAGRALEEWLAGAGVRHVVRWGPRLTPYVEIGIRNLSGALALELLRDVATDRGTATCAACGRDYEVWQPRKPQSGRRSFCRACHLGGAPLRMARADSTQRLHRGIRHRPDRASSGQAPVETGKQGR